MAGMNEDALLSQKELDPGVLVVMTGHFDDGVPPAVGGQAPHRTRRTSAVDRRIQSTEILVESSADGALHMRARVEQRREGELRGGGRRQIRVGDELEPRKRFSNE